VPSIDALVLRRAGGITVVVGLLAVVVGYLVDGTKGLIGAALGAVIVIVFFTVGQLIVGSVLRNNPEMAMTVAMTTYLVKIGVLFGLVIVLQGTTAFNTKVFATTIVACTLAWTVAEVWVFAKTKVLYVEPERRP
jgi:ATP synthase protein I